MGWDLGGLGTVDFFVIATISIYVAVIMLAGWWFSRKVHDMADFLVAGCKLPCWMATNSYCPTFGLDNIDDSMLSRGAMYGCAAALLAVVAPALVSPRRADEPGIWMPRRDESVPPELERAAQNDKLIPPPILG